MGAILVSRESFIQPSQSDQMIFSRSSRSVMLNIERCQAVYCDLQGLASQCVSQFTRHLLALLPSPKSVHEEMHMKLLELL